MKLIEKSARPRAWLESLGSVVANVLIAVLLKYWDYAEKNIFFVNRFVPFYIFK